MTILLMLYARMGPARYRIGIFDGPPRITLRVTKRNSLASKLVMPLSVFEFLSLSIDVPRTALHTNVEYTIFNLIKKKPKVTTWTKMNRPAHNVVYV